jgi:hypothetical protein
VVFLGGCPAEAPPLSKEAKAFKEELLKGMDKLTKALREPVAQKDAQAVNQILKNTFGEITSAGKLVPFRITVLDRDVFRLGAYPPPKVERRLNFRQYKEVNPVYQKGQKAQISLFYKGEKIHGLIAPIKQGNKVIGAVAISFLGKELNRKNVSAEEFLKIDFNQ